MSRLRVVATDLTTGRVSTCEVRAGDYLVIAVDPCRVEVVHEQDGGAVRHLRVSGRIPGPGDEIWTPGG